MKGAANKFLARIPRSLELGSDSLPGVICDPVPASPLFESGERLVNIGSWTLREACGQLLPSITDSIK